MFRWNVWRHSAIIYYFIMLLSSDMWKNFENEWNEMKINNSRHCVQYVEYGNVMCIVVRYLKRQQNEIQFEGKWEKTLNWILNFRMQFLALTRWWVHFIYSHCSHRPQGILKIYILQFSIYSPFTFYILLFDVQVAFASSGWIMMIKRNQKWIPNEFSFENSEAKYSSDIPGKNKW